MRSVCLKEQVNNNKDMIRTIQLLSSGLALLLLLGNFQCGKTEKYPLPFLLRDWQSSWLDNSGAEPLPAQSPVPRNAFGIRLSARMSADGLDTLPLFNADEAYLEVLHPINKIQVFTLSAFDSLAAGADISSRFRIRSKLYSTLEYDALDNANSVYNFPEFMPEGYQLDLLMISPPAQPGEYQFAVKIQYITLTMPLSQDTLLTLPNLILQ